LFYLKRTPKRLHLKNPPQILILIRICGGHLLHEMYFFRHDCISAFVQSIVFNGLLTTVGFKYLHGMTKCPYHSKVLAWILSRLQHPPVPAMAIFLPSSGTPLRAEGKGISIGLRAGG
jgi:hypothetical protein